MKLAQFNDYESQITQRKEMLIFDNYLQSHKKSEVIKTTELQEEINNQLDQMQCETLYFDSLLDDVAIFKSQ